MKAWRFLADENLEAGIIRALREAGHDVLAVAEEKPRTPDEDILAAARRHKRVLVTNDKDFAELMFLQGRASEGIILLRMSRLRTRTKAARLTRELEGRSPRLGRAMLVIEEAAARVRPVHGSPRIRRRRK